MRSSNKSRSRNKNNNRRYNPGNVVNRVFDSSGPEGKVRGTPQQIIDKYQTLARDAQLSGDRVAYENFLQHSEHYSRLLSEAQRELAKRKENQQSQQKPKQETPAAEAPTETSEQPDVVASEGQAIFPNEANETGLVETPEADAKSTIVETAES
ncbi:MAG: DUF4167 domain-containing protein [Pseudomonadota bacterium]